MVLFGYGKLMKHRSATFRGVPLIYGLGPTVRLPAVSVRSFRQLFRLEGNMYRSESLVGREFVEAGLQG